MAKNVLGNSCHHQVFVSPGNFALYPIRYTGNDHWA